jgi:hypothetical protein
MAFKGKYRVRTKTITKENSRTGQSLQISRYDVTFLEETDIDAKIKKFQNICGTIGRTLKGKARKDTQIKFYQVIAVSTLLYGSECWTMRKRDIHKPQAAEMRFLRSVKVQPPTSLTLFSPTKVG